MSLPQSYQENYRLVDKYDTTYWSGQDLEVYFNDIHMDETTQVNWQVLERIQPYYHYSDFVASRIHHGARIVNGEITVNFKQSGYMYSVLEAIRSGNTSPSLTQSLEEKAPRFDETSGVSFDPENANDKAITAYIKSYSNSVKVQEDRVASVYNGIPARVRNRAGIFETAIGGFDITVLFGNHLTSGLSLRYNTENNYYARNSIKPMPEAIKPVTGIKILGVSILGTAIAADDSGRPIMETFSFQARNIVPISKN